MAAPKLRFKDEQGRDYPAWLRAPFGNLFLALRKNALARDTLNYEHGDIKNIHYGDILVKFASTVKSTSPVVPYVNTDKIPKSYDILKCGDIIIADTAEDETAGKGVEIIDDSIPTISGLHTLPYRPQAKFAPGYLGYFLNSPYYHKQLIPLLHGIKVLSVTKEELEKTIISYPTVSEQQKITDFLTAYDTMIDTQTKRVETMKTRKKGLLQKIFSQEIRFKDDHGQDFPEWKSKKLGESTYIERGGSPRPISKYITGDSNGINWIKIGDAPVEGNVITSVKEKIISEGVPKSRKVFKGDLILSNSMSYGRPYLLAVDGCIHDGWLLIRNDKNIFDIRFLMQELASQYVKAQYDRLSNQGVVSNLNKELVKSVFIKIPSLPEQKKIADFLTAVDTQIEVEEKRLETMKTIKKGLLQQMFI